MHAMWTWRHDGFAYWCSHALAHKDYSQLSEDKDFFNTYYTSQTEWHLRGPCGYRGEESELFSILKWAHFSWLLRWKYTLVPPTLYPSSLPNDTLVLPFSVSFYFFQMKGGFACIPSVTLFQSLHWQVAAENLHLVSKRDRARSQRDIFLAPEVKLHLILWKAVLTSIAGGGGWFDKYKFPTETRAVYGLIWLMALSYKRWFLNENISMLSASIATDIDFRFFAECPPQIEAFVIYINQT